MLEHAPPYRRLHVDPLIPRGTGFRKIDNAKVHGEGSRAVFRGQQRVHTARFGTIFLDCQMRSRSLIVICIRFQMPHQARLVEHDQVIQTLRANVP